MEQNAAAEALRVLALGRIASMLATFYSTEEMAKFLTSSHAMLGGRRPCDLIDAGQWQSIELMLKQMDEGAYT